MSEFTAIVEMGGKQISVRYRLKKDNVELLEIDDYRSATMFEIFSDAAIRYIKKQALIFHDQVNKI